MLAIVPWYSICHCFQTKSMNSGSCLVHTTLDPNAQSGPECHMLSLRRGSKKEETLVPFVLSAWPVQSFLNLPGSQITNAKILC